jgi:hypothetical protein
MDITHHIDKSIYENECEHCLHPEDCIQQCETLINAYLNTLNQ